MKNPKKKIEIIFYLIKRMSRTDKRRFKLNNQIYKGTDKDFVRLFDFINQLRSYDTEKIERFFVEKKIKNKNLCIGYLLTKLVNSIDDGTLELIDGGQKIIASHMRTLRTYIKMELIDLAYKELLIVEQLAQQYHLPEYLFYIYSIWEGMMTTTHIDDRQLGEREKLHLKRTKLMKHTSALENIGYALVVFLYCESHSQKFKDNYQLMLKYKEYDLSPANEMLYNHTMHWHSTRVTDYKSAFEYSRNCIEIFHQNPDLMSTGFEDYLVNWHRLLLSAIKSQDKRTIDKYFDEYQQLPQRFSKVFAESSEVVMARYELAKYRCKAIYAINNEDYESIIKINESILKMFEGNMIAISRSSIVVGLFIQLAYGFILLGDMNNAQYWIDKITDLPYDYTEHLPDMIILKLIILYEEKSFVLLESKIRSIRRRWKTEVQISKVAVYIFNTLSNLLKKKNRRNLSKFYQVAHQEILKLENENNGNITYSKWIAQKI